MVDLVMTVPDSREDTQELARRRRTKNWALFAALVAFVVIIYFVSIVRMGGM